MTPHGRVVGWSLGLPSRGAVVRAHIRSLVHKAWAYGLARDLPLLLPLAAVRPLRWRAVVFATGSWAAMEEGTGALVGPEPAYCGTVLPRPYPWMW